MTYILYVPPLASSESKFGVKSLDENTSVGEKGYETETTETDNTDSDSDTVSDAVNVRCGYLD